MNQKNSLGLDICFKDLDDPIDLFKEWLDEAKVKFAKNPTNKNSKIALLEKKEFKEIK